MPPHLFVYGTLKPGLTCTLGAPERARLAAEATAIGQATTSGILVDLGGYPGLLPGTDVVNGFVYNFGNPEMSLKWLDNYEGYSGSAAGEYRRELRNVNLASGPILSCWTYMLIQSKVYSAVIRSGHWFPA